MLSAALLPSAGKIIACPAVAYHQPAAGNLSTGGCTPCHGAASAKDTRLSIFFHILGQPLIQSKRERKKRRTFVPGMHFEFFVPNSGQNFEKKIRECTPLVKRSCLNNKRELSSVLPDKWNQPVFCLLCIFKISL